MIVKTKRIDEEGRFDLKVIDRNNNVFLMMVGGNQDLFWVPVDYKRVKTFYIEKSDRFAFRIFEILFDKVKEREKKLNLCKEEDVFEFISEDRHIDDANLLKIIKQKDCFEISFVKQENIKHGGFATMGCPICFCNSGSRVPEIEQLFMIAFTELAYYNKKIELEKE